MKKIRILQYWTAHMKVNVQDGTKKTYDFDILTCDIAKRIFVLNNVIFVLLQCRSV